MVACAAFKVNLSIREGEKIMFTFRIILIRRIELAFPSYENQKEKFFQGLY